MTLTEPFLEAAAGQTLDGMSRQRLRAYPAVVDGKKRKTVECGAVMDDNGDLVRGDEGCGGRFTIADRTLRERNSAHKPLICDRCRKDIPVTPTDVTRRWADELWAYGYLTLDDIVNISEGIWGPRSEWA